MTDETKPIIRFQTITYEAEADSCSINFLVSGLSPPDPGFGVRINLNVGQRRKAELIAEASQIVRGRLVQIIEQLDKDDLIPDKWK